MTDKTEGLIEAYNNTRYVFEVFRREVVLVPGLNNFILDNFLRSKNLDPAAILTAWNPRSASCLQCDNNVANNRLLEELKEIGVLAFLGFGEGLDGNWPSEDSFLACGLDEMKASKLADKYEQNAFIFYEVEREASVYFTNISKDIKKDSVLLPHKNEAMKMGSL